MAENIVRQLQPTNLQRPPQGGAAGGGSAKAQRAGVSDRSGSYNAGKGWSRHLTGQLLLHPRQSLPGDG